MTARACTKDDVVGVFEMLEPDARSCWLAIGMRLLAGQRTHGTLALDTDHRNWTQEHWEEIADAMVYREFRRMQRIRRESPVEYSTDGPSVPTGPRPFCFSASIPVLNRVRQFAISYRLRTGRNLAVVVLWRYDAAALSAVLDKAEVQSTSPGDDSFGFVASIRTGVALVAVHYDNRVDSARMLGYESTESYVRDSLGVAPDATAVLTGDAQDFGVSL